MGYSKIEKICVIGSGVMGSGIAALIANSSHHVVLLDIASKDPDNKNSIVENALKHIKTSRPPDLSYPSKLEFIKIGNLDDDLELLQDCDLIIEVIIEKLEVKHQLYDKISPYLKDGAILSSNTSTLPLKRLKEKLPDSVKARFVITHFFNPPRYMELLELVTDPEVSSDTIDKVSNFISIKLGKTIVRCNDTPGFIANRVGCFLLELVVRTAIAENLSPVIIDKIFHELLHLPSTGIFGLYDLIGHDVMKLISTSLVSSLPENDDYKKIYQPNPLLDKMISENLIGRKGKGGFYRLSTIDGVKTKEVINFNDLSYYPVNKDKLEFSSIDQLLKDSSPYGKFFQHILARFYLYVTSLIPVVTDDIYDIDNAMKLGYNWKFGPFEQIYNMKNGFEWIKGQAEKLNLPLSEYIADKDYSNIEIKKFHKDQILSDKNNILLKNDAGQLALYKDNLVFSITTKMNCLNSDVFNLLLESIDIAEDKKQNLYIKPLTTYFSAGADLKFVSHCINNKEFTELENFLKLGQKAMMRLKYAHINVISCASGVALGGGCEILLHSHFVIANQELNAGLVEVSVGLVPGWGGCKEMFLRGSKNKDRLIKNLNNILSHNKSSSGDYFIIDYGIENAKINMNKQLILDDALNLQLPPKKDIVDEDVTLPQVDLTQELNVSEYNEHQKWLLSKFQNVISLQEVTEDQLLEFERETFLEIAKTKDKFNF